MLANSCTDEADNSDGKIVFGNRLQSNSFTGVVGFSTEKMLVQDKQYCTGSFVSSHQFLTAAHCVHEAGKVFGPQKFYFLDPSNNSPKAGDFTLKTPLSFFARQFHSTAVYQEEAGTYDFDWALIDLSPRAFGFNSFGEAIPSTEEVLIEEMIDINRGFASKYQPLPVRKDFVPLSYQQPAELTVVGVGFNEINPSHSSSHVPAYQCKAVAIGDGSSNLKCKDYEKDGKRRLADNTILERNYGTILIDSSFTGGDQFYQDVVYQKWSDGFVDPTQSTNDTFFVHKNPPDSIKPTETARGDSGGPLLYKNNQGAWEIAAVVRGERLFPGEDIKLAQEFSKPDWNLYQDYKKAARVFAVSPKNVKIGNRRVSRLVFFGKKLNLVSAYYFDDQNQRFDLPKSNCTDSHINLNLVSASDLNRFFKEDDDYVCFNPPFNEGVVYLTSGDLDKDYSATFVGSDDEPEDGADGVDGDNDGVSDENDRCPDSAGNEEVDSSGCSLGQYTCRQSYEVDTVWNGQADGTTYKDWDSGRNLIGADERIIVAKVGFKATLTEAVSAFAGLRSKIENAEKTWINREVYSYPTRDEDYQLVNTHRVYCASPSCASSTSIVRDHSSGPYSIAYENRFGSLKWQEDSFTCRDISRPGTSWINI